MNDILVKKIGDNPYSWVLYINQILAAIRFHPSESTKFSPFYLLYSREEILPLDNLLIPRRKYQGDDYHEIALQEQHGAFTSVRENLRKARKRQMHRLESKTKSVEFKVGDIVYYKNHQRQSKLDKRGIPFYVLLEKTGPMSYKIKNQLTNTVTKAHAEHLRAADVHKWDIPSPNRRIRKTILAVPVSSESSDTETAEEDGDDGFVRKRYECVRENSNNESDIPIMQRQLALNDEVDMEAIDRDSDCSGCEQRPEFKLPVLGSVETDSDCKDFCKIC